MTESWIIFNYINKFDPFCDILIKFVDLVAQQINRIIFIHEGKKGLDPLYISNS